MAWTQGDVWRATVPLPAGAVVEYKYVLMDASGHPASWQRGNNCVLAVGDPVLEIEAADGSKGAAVQVLDNWEGSPGAAVVAGGVATTREARLAAWAGSVAAARGELSGARLALATAAAAAAAAREQATALRAALADAEAGRLAAVKAADGLRAANAALRARAADDGASIRAALAHAARLMGGAAA
jgi:hypothetical protein